MRTNYILAGLMASSLFTSAAIAQSAPQQAPARAPAAAMTTTAAPLAQSPQWRASKLIGVNVYNGANEKIGDINEILLSPDGKVAGVVVGVGGFLGMGEHDVLVTLDKIKFVNEPVRTSSAAPAPSTTTRQAPATTTGTSSTTATRPARAPNEKWYPDHAVMNATKDQLKAMPAFKYN